MTLPAPPARSFASDNAAGAHPAVLEAIARVNVGHALAYGDDDETRACERRFSELFGRDVTTLLTFNGTGANVLALTALARPGDAAICTEWAHVNVDETGAPERIAGIKLIDVAAPDGKVTPEHIADHAHALGDFHHAQPTIVSITQSTELGTAYTADEIAALCDAAHRHGMRVHMDGARIANAVASAGGTVAALRAMTIEAGVDVMTFGGTKNGMLGGEAVRVPRPDAGRARAVRPQDRDPAAVEDAVRGGAVQCPARTTTSGSRWRATPTAWRPSCTPRSATSQASIPVRRRSSTVCSRRFPRPRSRRCRRGASSGTGTDPVIRCAG